MEIDLFLHKLMLIITPHKKKAVNFSLSTFDLNRNGVFVVYIEKIGTYGQ